MPRQPRAEADPAAALSPLPQRGIALHRCRAPFDDSERRIPQRVAGDQRKIHIVPSEQDRGRQRP
jgi:hypothetical protein